jgi:hypothetical protein
MGISAGPNSISDNLAFHIDPANPRSYAGVGTVIYDLSGNGNTSNFTNGAFYQNYQKGVVVVDGNNDYISTPIFNLTSPVTVSVWVKNVVDESFIMGAAGPGINNGNGEGIFYFGGKSIYIQGANTDGKYYQFPQLNLNQWVNLIMTRDVGNNMRVYFNGIGSTSNPQSHSNTIQMNQIGRFSSYTNQYNTRGSIGEVKIYNRALSASEVLQNYNASKKRYVPEENYVTSNLVVNLDFGDTRCYPGTGNTAYDLTGLGHTASLVNGAALNLLYGGNILCDGTNDYIEVQTTSALDFGANNFSVEYWYRKTEWTTAFENIWGPNIWRAGGDAVNNEWSLGIGQGAYATAGIGESVGFYIQTQSFGIRGSGEHRAVGNLNKFNQIVGIRNGDLIQLYYNGSVLYSANPGGGFDNTMQLNNISNNIRICNSYLDLYHSKAHTGILRIYNKALSAREVNQNYQALLPRFSDPALITDGLILNYDFGSAETYPGVGTNAQNLVGTELNGTLTNSPTYSTNSGGSIYLDGTNDYIGVTNNSALQPTYLTVEIWFKLNVVLASQPTAYPLLLDKYSLSSLTGYRLLFERGADELQFTVFDSVQDNKAAITGAGAKLSQNWNCVQGTFDGNTTKIYLNGVLQQTFTRTFSISYNNEDLYLGTYYAVSDGFQHYINAYLGNVRIYNRALSQSEISQNFNNMRNRFGV